MTSWVARCHLRTRPQDLPTNRGGGRTTAEETQLSRFIAESETTGLNASPSQALSTAVHVKMGNCQEVADPPRRDSTRARDRLKLFHRKRSPVGGSLYMLLFGMMS